MRFRDIPQFTPSGAYQIDVPLTYIPKLLKSYETDFGLEMNPDFQRGNVWSDEQQMKYLKFFLRGGRTANIIYFNCPSFGKGETERCDYPQMVLVDGLQRLTSFLRFLNNEIPVFNTYYKDFEDAPRDARTMIKFNINDLQTREEVLRWYIEMNSGGIVHSTEEISRVTRLLNKEICKNKAKSIGTER